MVKILKRLYRYFIYDNSKPRDKWVTDKLSKISNGAKLLDAGAGELRYKKYCSHLDYYAQDITDYDGIGNNKGLQTKTRDYSGIDIVSDITSIPVKNNEFDVILCTEVFEHIPYPIEAIKEFNRILKTGGELIITAPVNSLTHYAPYYYYNGFSKYFYQKFLPENGFKLIEMELNGNYFEYITTELGRIPNVINDYSSLKFITIPIYLIFIIPILFVLKISALMQSNSEELLTTGLHIIATKK